MKKSSLKNVIKTLLLLTFSILFVIGFFIEPDEIVVHKVTLKLNNWDKKHDNLKIAVISDIHAGAPFINADKIRKIVELSNKENPDLILLPGDFVSNGVIGETFVKPDLVAGILSKLKSKYGIIAVLGNNDWGYNGKKVTLALENKNITVLENNAKELIINGKPLWIAGVADLIKRFPDIDKALSKINGKSPILLLSHNPDVFPFIPDRVNLTIAGHTHGGQVDLPFAGRLIVPSGFGERYAFGHIHENNKDLYVSTGIGTSMIPVRFGVLPEIVILTIKSN
ncbi:MAG: hypothetical protein A2039_04800 [Candidatus Melainabacteria bacterium GWA2_34_9]|nr:MAG: hypothetical protein A2039_04800 [Candidatus Melainabacteria bacterium GWA2_34_9]